MTFSGDWRGGTRTNRLDFGGDPDLDLDPEVLKDFLMKIFGKVG